MSHTLLDSITWAQSQRLKFIERQLLWGRSLKARMLTKSYGISRHQANKDIKLYTETFPDNVKPYSAVESSHRPTATFKPQLTKQDPVEVLQAGGFQTIEYSDVESIQLIQRRVIDGVIPAILSAIESQSDIETIYASSSTPTGKRRRLFPSALIHTANRLHMRAYCYEKAEFRDFVLSRMLTKPKLLKAKQMPGPDIEFMEEVEITLMPNPALPKEGQDLIDREYQLKNSSPVKLRKCLAHYFLQANALPVSERQTKEAASSPWSFPVTTNYLNFW